MARPLKHGMNLAAAAALCLGCFALSIFVIVVDHDPFAWLGVLGCIIWGAWFAVRTVQLLRSHRS
jgi:protein-S-isoprenylcysteine O-methyltransferase Ste14